jgi:hypothetical protein
MVNSLIVNVLVVWFAQMILMAKLVRALQSINWLNPQLLDSCQVMTSLFYLACLKPLNFYLPTRYVVHHPTYKPSVTDGFRRLISQRQFAFINGNIERYHQLRNNIIIW